MEKVIQINDVIGEDFWGVGVTASNIGADTAELKEGDKLIALVNSPGGSVMEGWAIFNRLRGLAKKGVELEARVEGLAASMASVVMLAFDKVTAARGSRIMIHNVWGGAVGDADELRHEASIMESMTNEIAQLYAEKSGKSVDEIRGMMDAETWLTAQEALDTGLVTDVDEGLALAAFADVKKFGFTNIPADLEWKGAPVEDEEETEAPEAPAEGVPDKPSEEPDDEVATEESQDGVIEPDEPADPEAGPVGEPANVAEQERARILGIQNLAFAGQEEIVSDLIKEGTNVTASALVLIKDAKERGLNNSEPAPEPAPEVNTEDALAEYRGTQEKPIQVQDLEGANILDQYKAIKDPGKAGEFYRKNKAAILKAQGF